MTGTRSRPWHGVLVATALPYRDDLSVDFDAYADHVRWLADERLPTVSTPNGSLGEYQVLTARGARRRSSRSRSQAAPAGFVVMPGVGAYGAIESRRWAEQAAEAGAQAVMALPPNAYRDRHAGRPRALPRGQQGRAAGDRVQQPDRHEDRPDARAARRVCTTRASSWRSRSSAATCAGPTRSPSSCPGLDLLIGTDDVVLELGIAGATGWVAGYPNAFPRSTVALYEAAVAGDLATALPLYRLLHPLLRWDSKTEFVQAIKLSMDIVGRKGGACRPPRQPLTAEQEQRVRDRDRGSPRRRASLTHAGAPTSSHAVDSHTEGMPTRVITGGVASLPGATMMERRQWFLANSDDLRTLLMYEPRGHSAMSGAILQPPTRPDADWGVLYIEVSGCLPMCGHGTIGVATVLVETGMVAVTEPVTTIRLDTPAGLVVAEVAVEDGARRGGHDPQRAVVLRTGWTRRWRYPGSGRSATTWPTAATSTRWFDLEDLGLPFDRAHKQRAAGRRTGDHGSDQRARRARSTSPNPRDQRLPPRRAHRSRLGRPALAPRDGDLSGLVRPEPVRHRHERPHGAAARPW